MPDVAHNDSDDEIFEEEGGFRIGGVYVPPPPVAVCSSETFGTRLIISQIVNFNFKSYAGKQVLGPFHKCFTGIIGPNGSGKSNVIDSLLFVFGYRATKIRSKKLSVLLHKSEKHRDIRSATVEVHFHQINEKPDGTDEIVEGSKMVIARTANADNSSFYTINGKRCQFKDVALILRTHGIDLVHNRFLILQGEVEQIALMKPKAQTEHETGMLEYLEDIIGTARYKVPIQKLEAKVNELNDERLEKINRLRIAERERESLREPMEEAINFLALENEKTQTSNALIQLRMRDSSKLISSLEETKKKLDEAMAEVLVKIEQHKSEQAVMEKEVAAKAKELDGLKKLKEQVADKVSKNDSEMTKLKESISYTNKNRKKNIELKAAEEKKLQDLDKVPEKNQKEIEELKVVLAKLEDSRKTAEAEVDKVLASVREETQELQDKKETLLNELMGLTAKRDQAKSTFEIANTELSLYQDSEKTEKAKLERLRVVQETNQKRMQDLKGVQSHLEEKLPAAEKELVGAMKELDNLKREDATLSQEFNSKRASLEEKRSSVNAFRSRNKVLNFIMQKKAEGELPGVFGRLGDLGGIDPRFDCAISTACGTLDHIVTDTVDTATKCVELLKKYDVGRGNFLALDKQQHLLSAFQKPFRAPENVPRLFDLVQVQDDRVKPAFYFALRDTLVANDLLQGRRVAYGATRYRVVTVEGEVIELAGTMSGGGRDKKTGRMGRSATVVNDDVDQVEMSRMESRVTELQQRLTQMQDRMRDRENTISTLTRDTRKWKLELNNATAEIKELVLEEPKIKERIKAQEDAVKAAAPDPKALQQLTNKVEKLKQEFDKSAADSDKVQKEVDKYTAQIKAMAGGRMKEAQKKLDEINKKLDKVSGEIVKLTVEIKTSVRNSKRSAAKIENLTSDIAEAEEKLRSYDEALKALALESREKDAELEKITGQIEGLQGTVKGMKSKIAEVLKTINKIRSDKIDDDKKLDEVKRKLSDAKSIPKRLKHELSKLKVNQVPFRPPVPDLVTYTEEELETMDEGQLNMKELQIDEQLKHLKPNLSTIEEFQNKDAVFSQRNQELEDVNARRDEVRQGFEDLRKARLNEFMEGFSIISLKLKEMYQTITMGGDAEFDLLDSLDPFAEGVSFSVRPPKKSWKNIANLSGGEKTLSSLALVFALHYYKPSPLYVMDEIDAALDFKNVSIVGHYVKERTRNAQFIIISLRSNMFELANLLVGIYKTHNCTKSLTILSPEGGFKELVPFIAGGLVNGNAAPGGNEDVDMGE